MRKCLKCGHVSRSSPDPIECPQCGAVYAKVEAALGARTSDALAPESLLPRSRPARADRGYDGAGPYLLRLRDQSSYPTYRRVVAAAFWLYCGAVALAAGMAWRMQEGWASAAPLVLAVVAVVFALCLKQAALMLADIADAAVRNAELAECEQPSRL